MKILVDLAGVTYMDSSGVGMMAAKLKTGARKAETSGSFDSTPAAIACLASRNSTPRSRSSTTRPWLCGALSFGRAADVAAFSLLRRSRRQTTRPSAWRGTTSCTQALNAQPPTAPDKRDRRLDHDEQREDVARGSCCLRSLSPSASKCCPGSRASAREAGQRAHSDSASRHRGIQLDRPALADRGPAHRSRDSDWPHAHRHRWPTRARCFT